MPSWLSLSAASPVTPSSRSLRVLRLRPQKRKLWTQPSGAMINWDQQLGFNMF